MPNLVVYVPAQVARTLAAKGVSEEVQRRACKEVLVGLANGGLEAGVRVEAGDADGDLARRVAPASSPPSPRRSAPVSEQRGKAGSFSPDFKKGAKQ